MSCRVGLLGDMQQSESIRVLGLTDLSGTEAICKETCRPWSRNLNSWSVSLQISPKRIL